MPFKPMLQHAAQAVMEHPATSAATVSGVSLVIMWLQDAQQVASLMVALLTSIAALAGAGIALYIKWRELQKLRNQKD